MTNYSFDGLVGQIQRFEPFESKCLIKELLRRFYGFGNS